MNGPTYPQAVRFAKAYEAKGFVLGRREVVFLQHHDGSSLFYTFAFVVRWHDWYLIFTEHHGRHVYHVDDVRHLEYGARQPVKRVE